MSDKLISCRAIALALLMAAALPGLAAEPAGEARWVSGQGLFRVGYVAPSSPPPLNRMHAWELIVEDAAGRPVANAEISVSGGMPAHDHGLPTAPRITEYLGDGRYRLEGLRFHMMGEWEITLEIEAGEASDTAIIPLSL